MRLKVGVVLCFAVSVIWGGVATVQAQTRDDVSKTNPSGYATLEALESVFEQVAQQSTPSVVRIECQTGGGESKESSGGEEAPDQQVNPFEGTPWEDLFKNFHFYTQPGQGGQGGMNIPQPKARILGSGVIIDGKQGYILTNNHVVNDSKQIKVFVYEGPDREKSYDAEIVGQDKFTEVAVIKITELKGAALPEAVLGDSDSVKIGQWVLAIGNPLNYTNTVTQGIVSAVGRQNTGIGVTYEDFIQTTAAINPGNSGGPLLNMKGEVIGINTFIAVSPGSTGFIGLGFAVPINLVKSKIDELVKTGKVSYGYMGVEIQPVSDDLAKYMGMAEPHGAQVSKVVAGGPADKAGLKSGDVVVEFEGKTVRDNRDLMFMVGKSKIGAKVTVTVMRGKSGKTQDFTITLAERPQSIAGMEGPGGGTTEGSTELGLTIQTMSSELAKRFGYGSDQKGVIITKVASGSQAEEKGLRAGDVVLEVDWQAVADADDFRTAVGKADKEKGVLLKVQRKQSTFYVVLELK